MPAGEVVDGWGRAREAGVGAMATDPAGDGAAAAGTGGGEAGGDGEDVVDLAIICIIKLSNALK